jgi:hypothetical protein
MRKSKITLAFLWIPCLEPEESGDAGAAGDGTEGQAESAGWCRNARLSEAQARTEEFLTAGEQASEENQSFAGGMRAEKCV